MSTTEMVSLTCPQWCDGDHAKEVRPGIGEVHNQTFLDRAHTRGSDGRRASVAATLFDDGGIDGKEFSAEVELYDPDDYITPEAARDVARALLAAADVVEAHNAQHAEILAGQSRDADGLAAWCQRG